MKFLYQTIKKIALISLLFFGQAKTVETPLIYKIFDICGEITGLIFERGSLNPKHKKMFEEISYKLGLDYRKIKATNIGILGRFINGYNSAMTNQFTNRVYFNQDCLEELDDETVKFLMAIKLIAHKENYQFKNIIHTFLLNSFRPTSSSSDPIIRQYLGEGIEFDYHIPGGFGNLKLGKLTFKNLIYSQLKQYQKNQADTKAITELGLAPRSGLNLINHLYHPDSSNWPLYAKIRLVFRDLALLMNSLPILKQHTPYLAIEEDRIDHILSLHSKYRKKQEEPAQK